MPGVASHRSHPHRQIIGVLLLGLLAPFPAKLDAQPPAAPLVVETDRGAVRGRLKTNHVEWLGIPYAAPPVGSLRWRPPRPADSWAGVRDASQPGNGCVQGTGWDPGYERPTLTEDCLFLNVYRPHRRAGAEDDGETLLPVFAWIHGGGFGEAPATMWIRGSSWRSATWSSSP